ncbi:HAD hydrolase family protein [Companilactobacillus farciminis]|nr:HAD hydrolase family protein [Companilactobacillus farciminis]
MQNAEQKIKDQVANVTDSNNDEGVLNVLEQLAS